MMAVAIGLYWKKINVLFISHFSFNLVFFFIHPVRIEQNFVVILSKRLSKLKEKHKV